MRELRWNPLLRTWTMVAGLRQNRPHLPHDWCPFCPGSGKVPDRYDVLAYPNDFPALVLEEPDKRSVPGAVEGPYRTKASYGRCEVILYSDQHATSLSQLPLSQVRKVVELWKERTAALSADRGISYVFPFENRGEEVGVTMPHPHGQLYAYPFVPLKIRAELESCREYLAETQRCLLCDMNKEEARNKSRLIGMNTGFTGYLPFFTDYPYGVFIVARRHIADLTQLSTSELDDLASMLKYVTSGFDALFERPFPYMMCVHQRPVNCDEFADADRYYHLHIEFYPPLRARDRIKWYASSEHGAWAALNPLVVEDTALELRAACSMANNAAKLNVDTFTAD